MADHELREAFNDCIDRLAAGQSLGDCLRQYPQYARELRTMLEVGGLVERAQAAPAEVSAAQARVRERIRQRAYAQPRSRAPYRAALLVASLALAFAAIFAAAENSLPGDSLYGLKRLEESARSALTDMDFASRRLDEIRALLAFRREAVVEFSGVISAQDGANLRIAGLDVQTGASTEMPQPVHGGDTVAVSARTTAQGRLIAQRVTLLERALPTPSPTAPTIAPTPAPTETTAPTNTATPAPSATATFSATPAPTETPSPTMTPTRTDTPAPTATPRPTDTLTVCVPTAPDGWVRYTIQVGDTVAGLALETGTTVEQLIAANCLPDSLMIIAGQRIYLPALPAARATAVPQVVAPTTQPTDDHSGSSGDNSGSDDHGGSSGDNSGSSDDHSGNSGSD